jgi:hypothetical protein
MSDIKRYLVEEVVIDHGERGPRCSIGLAVTSDDPAQTWGNTPCPAFAQDKN